MIPIFDHEEILAGRERAESEAIDEAADREEEWADKTLDESEQ